MVFDGKELVLVSAQGNPEPLLEYALAQPGLDSFNRFSRDINSPN